MKKKRTEIIKARCEELLSEMLSEVNLSNRVERGIWIRLGVKYGKSQQWASDTIRNGTSISHPIWQDVIQFIKEKERYEKDIIESTLQAIELQIEKRKAINDIYMEWGVDPIK